MTRTRPTRSSGTTPLWLSRVTSLPRSLTDRPGGLTAVLRILAEAKVSVEYMYAFVGNRQDGHAVVVMRTDNEEIAQQALDIHHISTLSPQDIYRL